MPDPTSDSLGAYWNDGQAGGTKLTAANLNARELKISSSVVQPTGPDAVAQSDAVRGQNDRFYREVGGVLIRPVTNFEARNDSVSRPQNIDLVTTDSTSITIKHDTIGPRALVDASATVGENLEAVGIRAITRVATDLKTTEILLRQTRSLNDGLQNPGNGTAWLKERGNGSPFTVTGLTNISADFVAYTEGLTNVAASWRMEEASGATLDDAIGANDGTVVGTPTAYGVTGMMPSNANDKAITTTGASTNEFTFPLAGITQAAFSVVMRAKFPSSASIVLRDATQLGTNGYAFGSDGGSPAKLFYRNGSNGAGDQFITNVLWSSVADNQPHTFGWTKNGATVAFYVDGVQVHTASAAGSTAITSPWHVARNGTTTPYSVVTLSHMTTYSRALTSTEMFNAHQAALADGLMRITHPDVLSTKTSEIKLTAQGSLRPVLIPGSVTATGFNVKFLDSSGTQIKVANSEMALGVSRDVQDIHVDPTSLSVPIAVEKDRDWADWVPRTDPVLWARLSESGTSYADEIGTNTGTSSATVTNGATSMVDGDADAAVTFDGAQGKIAFANPNLSGQWTAAIMFKPTGAGSVGSTTYGTIIGWGTGGSSQRIMINNVDASIYVEGGGTLLTSAPGSVPLNTVHRMFFVWDGTTQKVYMDGVLIASNVTANVALNKAFWLGSFLGTSTNYSFKGDMDELVLWDKALTLAEVQQGWANASDGVLLSERSNDVQISFRGLFETTAPPPSDPGDPNPVPEADPLPAGDIGGAASSYISLAPYRANGDLDFGPSSPWVHRALPVTQGARDAIELNGLTGLPNATSANWKAHLCAMWGFNPTTGADTAPTQGSPSLYMRVVGEFIYVVPDSQPLRMPLDRDTTVSGWAAQLNAPGGYYGTAGGVPIPADAMPHFTGDRYAFWYQPTQGRWGTFYNFIPQSFEEATTTIELTSSPSSGGFFMEFDIQDNYNQQRQTFFCQTPILYNDTAAAIESKMNLAKTASGITFAPSGTRNFADAVACTGGPLNVQPVVCSFQTAQALYPVTYRFTNNFMNAGSVEFTYKNADPWTWVFLSAVTDPDIANATHHLPYMNVPDNGGTNVPATSAATHIDWMPMIIDWNEYTAAYNTGLANGWDAPGTDLGHVIAISIGNCGTGHVYPATGGDGTLTNTDGSKYMEGGLITFRTDAPSTGIDPVMMPFFNTVKRYGMMAIDKTGGGMEPIFRNFLWPGVSRPFPVPPTFSFDSQAYTAYMRQMPYEYMQIIDPAAMLSGW